MKLKEQPRTMSRRPLQAMILDLERWQGNEMI